MVVQWLAVCCPVLPTAVACASLSGIGWMTTSLPPFYLFSLFFPFTAYTGRRPFHHTLTLALCALFAFPIIALPSFEELLLCLLTWGLLEPWK